VIASEPSIVPNTGGLYGCRLVAPEGCQNPDSALDLRKSESTHPSGSRTAPDGLHRDLAKAEVFEGNAGATQRAPMFLEGVRDRRPIRCRWTLSYQ
jgi:hypothetical protein